jgi:hypothetical protein
VHKRKNGNEVEEKERSGAMCTNGKMGTRWKIRKEAGRASASSGLEEKARGMARRKCEEEEEQCMMHELPV